MTFTATHYGTSVTNAFESSLEPKHTRDNIGAACLKTLPLTTANKADAVLRTAVTSFAPEDRAPAAYYRLVATGFAYAGKMPHVDLRGNNFYAKMVNPTLVGPSSDPLQFVDMSLSNIAGMVQDFHAHAQTVHTIIMQGIEFVKEDADEMRMWTDPVQTDLSECVHSAYAVMHAATQFTHAKGEFESLQLRVKTAHISILCGEGVKHWGMEPESAHHPEGMQREHGDHYGIAAQADALDMQHGEFPKGVQAFGHPRIAASVDVICQSIKRSYENLIAWAYETRERTKHLMSVIEGPHGSIFRNMRDHSLISQLTRWTRAVNCHFATFAPLSGIIVDADLTDSWISTVEQQWRQLPELIDEVNWTGADKPRSLRMPPVHLLMRLKLSYDFSNRTYLRSLLTHADSFLYRQYMGKGVDHAICYEPSFAGEEVSIVASDNIDPGVKQARFLNAPNGLFISSVFNHDLVHGLMDRLSLRAILNLMFSSRVFYAIASKNNRFWTHLANLFLIKHKAQIMLINGARMIHNIKFRPKDLPRLEGSVFEHHYHSFYCLQATLSVKAKKGVHFCIYCLAESAFRSSLLGGVVVCQSCYEKETVDISVIRNQRKRGSQEWFRQVNFLRTVIPWKLEHRPTISNKLHLEMIFSRDAFTLAMMQMSHLSRALSPALMTLDVKARLEDGVDIRYLLGGPHAQLREPPVVKLCCNFYKYSPRQYGVNKVTIENGHSHEGIRRFLGDYTVPRNPMFRYDMTGPNAKHIKVVHNQPESIDLTDTVNFPYYYKKHVPGQAEVYRVNRPFSVMTASQPSKICQVVATNQLHGDMPMCELCYSRAYAQGVDNMMVETDSDEEIVELEEEEENGNQSDFDV